jgi:hypothetical protein
VDETDRTCPSCNSAITGDARFCPSCGTRVDGAPGEAGSISYTQPEPRLFGVLLPVPTFILACVTLAGELLSFATGSVVLGVMLLAFAAALFVLFYGAAERNPEGRISKAAVDGIERVTGWWRFSRQSATAWSGAGRRVVQLRRELHGLRGERKGVQLELGDAAYAQDETKVASLRARMAEIDDTIGARERESAETVARARARVDDERIAVTPTQHLSPEPNESDQQS